VKITLDTNCIIDLEKNRPAAASLRALIDASRQGQVELAVAAISASEKMQSGDYLTNFSEFEERLEQVGLSGARILEPIGIWGVTFWGHFLWSDDSMGGFSRRFTLFSFQIFHSITKHTVQPESCPLEILILTGEMQSATTSRCGVISITHVMPS